MKINVSKIERMVVFAAFLTGVAFYTACSKSQPGSSSGPTTYNMYMTDAPSSVYQQVNVNIIGAEVNTAASGWVALHVSPGIYNLLTLTNGKDTLIATGQIPVGNVSQIRLILSQTGNTVMVNGTVYPLQTPSAQQSGLKLNVDATLMSGVPYNLTLDFDAGMSVVATGSGSYILKPVIRTTVSPLGSSIKGTIIPASAQAAIVATSNGDSSASYSSVVTGGFLVQGLAAGTYKVIVYPPPPYTIMTYTSVSVGQGQIMDMGTITLQ